jgi:hypothetical protein
MFIRDRLFAWNQTSTRIIIDALNKIARNPSDREKLLAAERKILELEANLGEAQAALRKNSNRRSE